MQKLIASIEKNQQRMVRLHETVFKICAIKHDTLLYHVSVHCKSLKFKHENTDTNDC